MNQSRKRARTTRIALVATALAALICACVGGEEAGPEPPNEAAGGTGTTRPDSGGETSKDAGTRPEFDATLPGDDAGDAARADADAGGDPTACLDPDDPGGTDVTAKQLPETDDCDLTLKTVNGVANGAVDVDMFKLTGKDKGGCSMHTEFGTMTAGLELCVFAECQNATVDPVSGCNGGTASTLPNGMKGCCTSGSGKATPIWDCKGITDNDSANFVLRVKPMADVCLPYSFSYKF